MKSRSRYVHLDVLRALAGLAVPMLHLQEGFVGTYLAILLIGYGVMRFWERVQSR